MSRTCSCGATLPDDARFCHRCGKPLYEEPVVQGEAPPPETRVAPAPSESAINLSDPIALRTALSVAGITVLLEIAVRPLVLLAPLLGGFLAVMLYARRTGRYLSVSEGARLGWITALMNVLIATVLLSVFMAINGSAIINMIRDQMKTQGVPLEQQQFLSTTSGLITFALFMWIFVFGFTTLMHLAGGALGAKLARKPR